MAYESVVLFISFGWFVSVTVIFLMYVRMRQMSEELKVVKNAVHLSSDEMIGLERDLGGVKGEL
jgi:hypothetical protein